MLTNPGKNSFKVKKTNKEEDVSFSFIDKIVREKHVSELLKCKFDDTDKLEKIKKDFVSDMAHFGINEEESEDLFQKLKKYHIN